MARREDGLIGERLLFDWLLSKNIEFFQMDAISFYKGKHYGYEVKFLERFVPPPFEGHGLPPQQIAKRLRYQEESGTRAIFIVFEKNSDKVFYQFLDVLEKGEYINTQGKKPRRVYNLASFHEETYTR